MYVCVDDPNIQLPNFISVVPTIYLIKEKRILVDEELEQWIDEQHKLQNEKVYSGKVANAMANANVSMTINKNKA